MCLENFTKFSLRTLWGLTLPSAALSEETEDFTVADVEGHTYDSFYRVVVFIEIFYLDIWGHTLPRVIPETIIALGN